MSATVTVDNMCVPVDSQARKKKSWSMRKPATRLYQLAHAASQAMEQTLCSIRSNAQTLYSSVAMNEVTMVPDARWSNTSKSALTTLCCVVLLLQGLL